MQIKGGVVTIKTAASAMWRVRIKSMTLDKDPLAIYVIDAVVQPVELFKPAPAPAPPLWHSPSPQTCRRRPARPRTTRPPPWPTCLGPTRMTLPRWTRRSMPIRALRQPTRRASGGGLPTRWLLAAIAGHPYCRRAEKRCLTKLKQRLWLGQFGAASTTAKVQRRRRGGSAGGRVW